MNKKFMHQDYSLKILRTDLFSNFGKTLQKVKLKRQRQVNINRPITNGRHGEVVGRRVGDYRAAIPAQIRGTYQ